MRHGSHNDTRFRLVISLVKPRPMIPDRSVVNHRTDDGQKIADPSPECGYIDAFIIAVNPRKFSFRYNDGIETVARDAKVACEMAVREPSCDRWHDP